MTPMKESMLWYQELIRPSWAPPSFLFGPVWSVLYVIIFVTYGYTVYQVVEKEWPPHLLYPLILNLVFNLLFTPIQFGLKNNWLASLDIVLVLVTLVWFLIAVYPHSKWVSGLNIPYLLWVLFATVLQFTITWLNR